MLEIIGMEEIMKDYNLSRRIATRYLNTKGYPALPRVKNAPYQVVREEFEKWLASQRK